MMPYRLLQMVPIMLARQIFKVALIGLIVLPLLVRRRSTRMSIQPFLMNCSQLQSQECVSVRL